MPSFETLGIMEGVATGLNDAMDTLNNISSEKTQLEREKKEFDVNMKIKNLELQKLEGQMDPELYKMQNEQLKAESKAKKSNIDYTMSLLNRQEKIEGDKARSFGGYLKGAETVAEDAYSGQGLSLGGLELDINAGLKGDFPYKQTTPTQQLKRAEASDELRKRAGAKEPLDTKIVESRKGWFGGDKNAETVEFAKTLTTRQSLIDMIKNADALEDRGIDVEEIEDLYEEELMKLATEGYLTEN